MQPTDRVADGPFSPEELAAIAALNQALYAAYGPGGSEASRDGALRAYLATMSRIGRRLPMFEIANHRLFRCADGLIVPYDAHGRILVQVVGEAGEQTLAQRRYAHGTLITDALIAEIAGRVGEPIDLEHAIYALDLERMPEPRITRIRDMVQVLERLNCCGSRYEAVYLLRFLVSRLCVSSSQGFPGAKNLQPELVQLRRELNALLGGPFAGRLRFPLRVLVRYVAGLVSSPKLIDELWQATIDLAEVQVRGSAITNEIRRSAHHGLGPGTLELARAYQCWLQTGHAEFPGHERPAAADRAAREREEVRGTVERIVSVLEQILGSAQITARIEEWRADYADALLRVGTDSSLQEDLEALIEKGIRAGNRWVYGRYLRNLRRKAVKLGRSEVADETLASLADQLARTGPEAAGFTPERVESELRAGVTALIQRLRAAHQDGLFAALDAITASYERGDYLVAFERCCGLRAELSGLPTAQAFPEQLYYLQLLDCLLEELGYLALRHLASGFERGGVQLDQCLRIVHLCAANLRFDGLYSRELWDLSQTLVDGQCGKRELLDVLEQLQKIYHRIVHRISAPYEALADRLGHQAGDLRGMLANFQRTLHDLNSLVHFADSARSHLQAHGLERQSGPRGASPDPWQFAHISDSDEIRRLVDERGGASLLQRYGGKGSGLLYLSYLGVPTRDGFIVPTTLARLGLHRTARPRFESEIVRHLGVLEGNIALATGAPVRLGDPDCPLLLAVRGGSVLSMPGMLNTVVFVGMTDVVAAALARRDPWFAWDAYRRFLASYAAAAWGLDLEVLDLVEQAKRRHGVRYKAELSGEVMQEIVVRSKDWLREQGRGAELDRLLLDPHQQLHAAVRAVHDSWDGERARRYRALKAISERWHTAVVVQQMAAGNRSNDAVGPGMDETRISLTGVIPGSRVQGSGFRELTGDVKFSATGDDLVGGLTAATSFRSIRDLPALAPMLDRRLEHIDARIRRFRGTDPEIEFTVEHGVLSVLQARSAQADAHDELTAFLDPGTPTARGIGIRGGAFRGLVAFTEVDVSTMAPIARGRDDVDGVLLVLENPTPDEIPLILSADALMTLRGGSTSHAAVAVQGIENKAYFAVMGVSALRVAADRRSAVLVDADGRTALSLQPGDVLSIHGQSGQVYPGSLALHPRDSAPPHAQSDQDYFEEPPSP